MEKISGFELDDIGSIPIIPKPAVHKFKDSLFKI